MRISLIVTLTVLCWSCAVKPIEPRTPDVLGEGKLRYTLPEFDIEKGRYESAMQSRTYDDAKISRDRIINRLRADVRDAHVAYEAELTDKMANWNIEGDLLQLALALAATVTKGNEAKTVLSAVIAATSGAKLSFDKNRFREKTSEILITNMRSARTEKDTALQKKLAMSVMDYPLEEALCDIVDLFHAGTLTEAFQLLAREASASEKDAIENAAKLTEHRIELSAPPRGTVERLREIVKAIESLDEGQLDALAKTMSIAVASTANKQEKIIAAKRAVGAATDNKAADDPLWKAWRAAVGLKD